MNVILNNRYRIIHALGKGGFGETFLSEDTHMPSARKCVVKQLRPASNDPTIINIMRDRFQREAAILEILGKTSDQIPELYASFTENDKFYLVQELIQGETLTQKIMRDGPFDESRARHMIQSLLLVLESVHSRGIIHRDIKPDNIMIRDTDGVPVLIDFGAVKEIVSTLLDSRGNPTSTIAIGSPGFMPIEQAAGKPVFASDLYSLGLSAVYLLTGIWPQTMVDHVTGDIDWRKYVPGISEEFAAVISKAIESHFRDRFKTAREMIDVMNTNKVNADAKTMQPPGIDVAANTVAPVVDYSAAEQFKTTAGAGAANTPHRLQAVTTVVTDKPANAQIPLRIQPISNLPSDPTPRKRVRPIALLAVILGLAIFPVAGGSFWYYRNHWVKTTPVTSPVTDPSSTSLSAPNQQTPTQTPTVTQPQPQPSTELLIPLVNVTGRWNVTTFLAKGATSRAAFQLKQDGGNITGSGFDRDDPKQTFAVTGTITGTGVRITITHKFTKAEIEENKGDGSFGDATYITVVMTGTVTDSKMSGSYTGHTDKKSMPGGKWSATKS